MSSPPVDLTLVIPVYNEVAAVDDMIDLLVIALGAWGIRWEVIIVDDGSTDGTREMLSAAAAGRDWLKIVRHRRNRGYGAAIKTGVREARGTRIALVDADLTYPLEKLKDLYAASLEGVPMVVGARTGEHVKIPWLRRIPKWVLRRLASYLTGTRIPDLNSGFRVFIRQDLLPHLDLLPNGFSFTSTITLVVLSRGEEVVWVPIDYYGRVGKSKIRPIRDTLLFFQLIIRTVTLFQPLKIFIPAALFLELLAMLFVVLFIVFDWPIPDATFAALTISGVILFGIGLLADLISRRLGHLHELLIHDRRRDS